ncbi:unnamed protein product [Lupinus luteus]|uniref:DUF4283 domain-containing protein n=1 Tax=Lupinus luteus TaxID=3873 RepID=A0AAV1XZ13_LUPLU
MGPMEDGWVVCRVFKNKNQNRSYQQEIEEEDHHFTHMRTNGPSQILEPKHHHMQGLYDYNNFDGSLHLPQLFSPESTIAPTPSMASSMNAMDILGCSQNLLRLTTTEGCVLNLMQQQQHGERFNGDIMKFSKEKAIWVRCWGLSLHTWTVEVFKALTEPVGVFIKVDESTLKMERLDFDCVLLAASAFKKINHIQKVFIGY